MEPDSSMVDSLDEWNNTVLDTEDVEGEIHQHPEQVPLLRQRQPISQQCLPYGENHKLQS